MSWQASLLRLIGGTPRPGEPSIATYSTTGWDASLGGVGSSPAKGDLGSSALVVPPAAGEYLFRLVSWYVPEGFASRIVSFAQYAEIGVTLATSTGEPYPVTRQITSPIWHPPGSNLAMGITMRPGILTRMVEQPQGGQAMDTSLEGYAPAMLIKPPPAALTSPLTEGLWPGTPIGDSAVIRDMRSPWGQNERAIDYAVEGDRTVTVWGWVKQRNLDDYSPVVLPEGKTGQGLGPEDQFMLDFPNALYTRIAARVTVEIYPDTNATRRRNL